MIEAGIVAWLLVAMALCAFAPVEGLAVGGLVLAIGGLALGVPAGVVYHVRLGRALARRGPLPARWWLSPLRHHRALSAGERAGFRGWFALGAAGFGLSLAGCALSLCGLLKAVLLS
ncbi:MAG: hypothetical protein QN159_12280 [Armatimonadota bacterium]|nr:hypothetical protein [Armatimonadota bacterium]